MEKGREDRPRYILRDHATIFFRAKLHRVYTYKLKWITTPMINSCYFPEDEDHVPLIER